MATKKQDEMTHVNCGGDYPGGRGIVIKRGMEYNPTPEELKAQPRRWAPIGSKRAKMAKPVPGVKVTQDPPSKEKGGAIAPLLTVLALLGAGLAAAFGLGFEPLAEVPGLSWAASFMFLKGKTALWSGSINWPSAVLRAIPLDTVPDPDTDDFVDDISADEVDSVRVTLANAVITEDAANDQVELDCDDFTFTGPNDGTMVGFAVYVQVGGDDTTPANDNLIAFLDTDDIVTNGGNINVTVNAEGLIKQ